MAGHMRGHSIRACEKGDEGMTLYRARGGCTLSHSIAWKINKKKPDSTGGIMRKLDRNQTQCDFRPGGLLSSGMARIGNTGFAEAGGTVGTPNFKSVSRPLAVAGMLPQGRLAGERGAQHEPIWHSAERVGSHLFLCYRIVFRFDRNHCGSSSIHKSNWFPHK